MCSSPPSDAKDFHNDTHRLLCFALILNDVIMGNKQHMEAPAS